MTPPRLSPRFSPSHQRRLSLGQASIEYLVVLAFGVIILLKPFSYSDVSNPNATKTEAPALKQLATAIKDYHKHYSYAMAIASIPDCDYQFAYDKSASASTIATLTGSVTVGFDRCIDWTNPQIPGLSIGGDLALNVATNVTKVIEDMLKDMIQSYIDKFTNPVGLLDDMFTSFF